MTTSSVSVERAIALELIDRPANVRELDDAHVAALAGSIRLRGLIVPLVVRPAGDRYELAAGFHRHAACQRTELSVVPAVIREQDGESADRAAENVVRKQLTPLEEARAVAAMLEQGYTVDGTATVLGWAKQRVSARGKILELPDTAQGLIGSGELPVSGVDAMLAIAAVSPALCEHVSTALADAAAGGNNLGASFARDPGWVVNRVLCDDACDVWAVYLTTVHAAQLAERSSSRRPKRCSRKPRRCIASSIATPTAARIEFSEADVNQARAAGVLLELGNAPLVLDRELLGGGWGAGQRRVTITRCGTSRIASKSLWSTVLVAHWRSHSPSQSVRWKATRRSSLSTFHAPLKRVLGTRSSSP